MGLLFLRRGGQPERSGARKLDLEFLPFFVKGKPGVEGAWYRWCVDCDLICELQFKQVFEIEERR
jgi:hypothetical protein